MRTSPRRPRITALCLIALCTFRAQADWQVLDTLFAVPRPALYDVQFVNRDTGWAVGAQGTIIRSLDGGATWQDDSSGTAGRLFGLHALSADIAYAVGAAPIGAGGVMLKRDGESHVWELLQTTDRCLTGVFFINTATGWATGDSGSVYIKTGSSDSLVPVRTDTTGDLLGLHFVDSQNGWAVGRNGTILHTSNAGLAWSLQESPVAYPLVGVNFLDDKTGWVAGAGATLLSTVDGGESWDSSTVGDNAGIALLDVRFADDTTGWVVGEEGAIFRTVNGMEGWLAQTPPTDADLWAVSTFDSKTAWVVGDHGTILRTVDAGANWIPPVRRVAFGIHFVDTSTGWLVGIGGAGPWEIGGTIRHTIDGGGTWTEQWYRPGVWLHDVHFTDSVDGWAVGEDLLLHTSDGGSTWQETDDTVGVLRSVHFGDKNHGWAAGDTLLRTSDAGVTWTGAPLGLTEGLNRVYFVDAQWGWAIGNSGNVYCSRDSGVSWDTGCGCQVVDASESDTCVGINGLGHDWNDVFFLDRSIGVLAGEMIFMTRDSGATWAAIDTAVRSLEGMNAVWMLDTGNIRAVGGNGMLLHTLDAGATWDQHESGTLLNLTCLHITEQGYAWAAGEDGVVVHGVDDSAWSAAIPRSRGYRAPRLRFSANYPNPFRATTTIRYSIPSCSRAVLSVHSALGQKVRVLVNKVLSPGAHTIVWDGCDRAGRHVAAGIYYATLTAGGPHGVETARHKMLLIR